jgi:menaquinone-specific isochorismate synthase
MTNVTNRESAASVGAEVTRLEPAATPVDACRHLAQTVAGARTRSRDGGLLRFETPLDVRVDPLTWLRVAAPVPRFYWSSRDGGPVVVGAGVADEVRGDGFDVIGAALRSPGRAAAEVRRFLTARFDLRGEVEDDWRHFGRIVLRLPLLELCVWKDRALLAVNIEPGANREDGAPDSVAAVISTLRDAEAAMRAWPPEPAPVTMEIDADAETAAAWTRNVDALTGAISSGRLRKAVLARAARLPGRADGADLLAHLVQRRPRAFRFLVQPSADAAFVGATPELLYRRRGRAIESEAVAGTRPRGSEPGADDRLGRELRASSKDAEEQLLVHEHIVSGLGPLCETLDAEPEPRLLKLESVQHLRSRVRGRLREGVSDADVLAALHPTPAVCGFPTEEALPLLRELERFDRGLYGGVVGMLTGDEAELAVAIRSALALPDEVRLFAGSGIVAGSRPKAEWAETELKLRAVAALLGEPGAGPA